MSRDGDCRGCVGCRRRDVVVGTGGGDGGASGRGVSGGGVCCRGVSRGGVSCLGVSCGGVSCRGVSCGDVPCLGMSLGGTCRGVCGGVVVEGRRVVASSSV